MSRTVDDPLFCITRMHYRNQKSWWVRLQRFDERGKRITHSKNFADLKLGGTAAALALAKRWRNTMLRKLPAKKLGAGAVEPGHGYVRRIVRTQRRATKITCWIAWLRVEGRRNKSATRSIALWGDAEARRQCELWLARERRELRKRQRGAP